MNLPYEATGLRARYMWDAGQRQRGELWFWPTMFATNAGPRRRPRFRQRQHATQLFWPGVGRCFRSDHWRMKRHG